MSSKDVSFLEAIVAAPQNMQNNARAAPDAMRHDDDMADCPGSAGQRGMILLLGSVLIQHRT